MILVSKIRNKQININVLGNDYVMKISKLSDDAFKKLLIEIKHEQQRNKSKYRYKYLDAKNNYQSLKGQKQNDEHKYEDEDS